MIALSTGICVALRIRHVYRKAAIYGALLFVFILSLISLEYAGVGREAIALIFLAIVLAGTIAYLLFGRAVIWLSRAKAVDEASEPRLYRIVECLSKRMGLKTPRLAVINDHLSDVFVSGMAGNDSIIFVTSGLLTEFDDDELKAILTHELETIGEKGTFIYNAVMTALSLLLIASGLMEHFLLLRNTRVPRDKDDTLLIIDKARISDVPAVVRLLIAHDMYNYVYLHDLARLARERSPLFLVARDGGKLVGFIIGEVNYGLFRRAVHIIKIVIDEDYRRKGIGSRLMRAFILAFEHIGYSDCRIEVRENNRNAISLYEKFGFKMESLAPMYYPDGAGCLAMVKSMAKEN